LARLFFASLITFGLLIGMVVGLVLAAMVASGTVNLTVAIVLTVVINLFIWLISPWLSDLTLRWFNQLEFLDDAAVKQRYPGIHQLIHQVAGDYRFKAPRIGFIPDRNPTAFTYGLLRSNARIVVTQGIFEFLSEQEQRAVVAHELGHIVNRDFIVMTAAGTLVQILYQVYAASMRAGRSGGKNKGGQALVGIAALVLYYVGIYLLYYLSRTREFLAGAFSAERVEARHLASALVKVAYGIVKVEDTEASQSLLQSTRHMGPVDVKKARYSGLEAESDLGDPARARRSMESPKPGRDGERIRERDPERAVALEQPPRHVLPATGQPERHARGTAQAPRIPERAMRARFEGIHDGDVMPAHLKLRRGRKAHDAGTDHDNAHKWGQTLLMYRFDGV